jgi:L-2-hydroxycarboxylate dehydrogenase (NAD+)
MPTPTEARVPPPSRIWRHSDVPEQQAVVIVSDAASSASIRVREDSLRSFTAAVLRATGMRDSDAETVAAVLVASDTRGIASHGVARLAYYVRMIDAGSIDPRAGAAITRESATTAVLDARNGLGHPVGVQAMNMAIEKAAAHDLGIVTVRHSNHYGIAGFYAMMALEHDQIGISLTNTHPVVAPTGGSAPTFGTNPIAIAAPTAQSVPFVLDMATSVVPRGRLEVAERRRQSLAEGWALDAHGRPTTSAEAGLAGALLPLGGPAITSGYKGYGLAMAVEMLSAVLPGSLYGPLVHSMWDSSGGSDLGQFFMAINIAAFDEPASFKARLSDLLERVKASPRAEGSTEILVAGEKEQRATEHARIHGVPVEREVVTELAALAERYGVSQPWSTSA